MRLLAFFCFCLYFIIMDKQWSYRRILIARTDNIGDVILTLPLAGWLKRQYPGVVIGWVGKAYTRPIIEACRAVDCFFDREAILADPESLAAFGADLILYVFPDRDVARVATKIGISTRVGTSHRLFHWWTANRLAHFSRKSSDLHEAQLNFRLLAPLGLHVTPSCEDIGQWYDLVVPPLEEALRQRWFGQASRYIVFHPKSRGSAREWPVAHYARLATLVPDTCILVTGTQAEGELIRQEYPALFALPHVRDLTGQLSLHQLMQVIGAADALVACSTGPLHIAAALGKKAIGLYPPIRPMHPGRWQPLGRRATVLVKPTDCQDCRKGGACHCIVEILPETISGIL